MKAWLAAALLTANVLALPAHARMHAGPSQLSAGHRLQGVIAPLDGGGSFSTPSGAYSLRRLKSTYAGPAVKLRRASDNATQDINFLGFTGFTGAPIDTAAAAAFCASTSCFYDTWYDQSGNGRNMVQATLANQPAYVADCGDGKPCVRSTLGSAQQVAFVSLASSPSFTVSLVEKTVARGSAECGYAYINSNYFNPSPASDFINLSNGAAAFNAPVTTLAWHAFTGVFAGAASLIRVDATETTGTVAPNTAPISWAVYGGAGATCDAREWMLWDGYVLPAGERAALQANQKSFWGTP